MNRPLTFPCPRDVEGDCVMAGGNLEPDTLLTAYRKGIFPWFTEEYPILWWSLDPRFVLFPAHIHVSRSLRRRIRKKNFALTLDRAFRQVVECCSRIDRPNQDGTWITKNMIDAYCRLQELGYAHSVEAWRDGNLVGGLYGVSLGGCFYGESMFSVEKDVSKIALTALVGILDDAGFGLLDCQQNTQHLASFGAISIAREDFLDRLQRELAKETRLGSWAEIFPDFPDSTLWETLFNRSVFCGNS